MTEAISFGFDSYADPQRITVTGPTPIIDEAMARTGLPLRNGWLAKVPVLEVMPVLGSGATEVTLNTPIIGKLGEKHGFYFLDEAILKRTIALKAPHLFLGEVVGLVQEQAVDPDPKINIDTYQLNDSSFEIAGVLKEPDLPKEEVKLMVEMCMGNTASNLSAHRGTQEPRGYKDKFKMEGDFAAGVILRTLQMDERPWVKIYDPSQPEDGPRQWRFKSANLRAIETPLIFTAGLIGFANAALLSQAQSVKVEE